MDKALKSFEAAAWAIAALLCFQCGNALDALLPVPVRFCLVLAGFILIGVAVVKLVRSVREGSEHD